MRWLQFVYRVLSRFRCIVGTIETVEEKRNGVRTAFERRVNGKVQESVGDVETARKRIKEMHDDLERMIADEMRKKH